MDIPHFSFTSFDEPNVTRLWMASWLLLAGAVGTRESRGLQCCGFRINRWTGRVLDQMSEFVPDVETISVTGVAVRHRDDGHSPSPWSGHTENPS